MSIASETMNRTLGEMRNRKQQRINKQERAEQQDLQERQFTERSRTNLVNEGINRDNVDNAHTRGVAQQNQINTVYQDRQGLLEAQQRADQISRLDTSTPDGLAHKANAVAQDFNNGGKHISRHIAQVMHNGKNLSNSSNPNDNSMPTSLRKIDGLWYLGSQNPETGETSVLTDERSEDQNVQGTPTGFTDAQLTKFYSNYHETLGSAKGDAADSASVLQELTPQNPAGSPEQASLGQERVRLTEEYNTSYGPQAGRPPAAGNLAGTQNAEAKAPVLNAHEMQVREQKKTSLANSIGAIFARVDKGSSGYSPALGVGPYATTGKDIIQEQYSLDPEAAKANAGRILSSGVFEERGKALSDAQSRLNPDELFYKGLTTTVGENYKKNNALKAMYQSIKDGTYGKPSAPIVSMPEDPKIQTQIRADIDSGKIRSKQVILDAITANKTAMAAANDVQTKTNRELAVDNLSVLVKAGFKPSSAQVWDVLSKGDLNASTNMVKEMQMQNYRAARNKGTQEAIFKQNKDSRDFNVKQINTYMKTRQSAAKSQGDNGLGVRARDATFQAMTTAGYTNGDYPVSFVSTMDNMYSGIATGIAASNGRINVQPIDMVMSVATLKAVAPEGTLDFANEPVKSLETAQLYYNDILNEFTSVSIYNRYLKMRVDKGHEPNITSAQKTVYNELLNIK